MAKKLTKVEREMRDHPERFDFGDIPPMQSGAAWDAYNREMGDREPRWFKEMKKDVAKKG
jgi:hypothetical protein